MDQRFRAIFNERFSSELYEDYKRDLSSTLDCSFEFRLAETPVFLPSELRQKLVSAAEEIIAQLSEPARIEAMRSAIPDRWYTPGMDRLPSIAQVDFAITKDADGTLTPRLIELQGFPSLTAFQVVQRDAWQKALRTVPELNRDWSCWFSGFDREQFLALAKSVILGRHDPDDVILMDLDPLRQKTYPDFAATKLLFGVDAVCPTKLTRRGRKLFRTAHGRERQVLRIYNRVVFDELQSSGVELPFDFRDELEVEWAPHPNWYWVWSKFSLPMLDHWSVPPARYLSDVGELPADLGERFVLKPLFSFAGGGVNVEPRAADVDQIPEADRRHWCLQEKIEYALALTAADGGGVKVEIRMMFFRPDDSERLVLGQNLARLSRGKMLGVDYNKDFTWVGSSVGLFPSQA